MPKTYWTPSASRHSTKTSDALRSLTPPPYLTGLAARLTRGRRRAWTMRTVRAALTVSGPAPIQVVGHGTYRGSLQFSPASGGGVQTVNAVGLDDYVRGVVAAEMPAGWAPAALQAQAIAARTYAITTSVGGPGYDL